jgi:flagellar hook-associated protein 3 FlgL
MKVSFVSSQAISSALRYQTARLQADLTNATKEMSTLRVADTGLALGARSSISVSLHREMERLEGITDSNELASARLKSTQLGLQQLTDAASDLLSNFSSTLSGAGDASIAQQQAEKLLSLMSSVLNTNLNGENIFAGINTDVRPFNDFLDTSSPNRVAFDTAFQGHFGFSADDPATANIAAADMDAFLAALETDMLGNAGWQNWSNATDQTISSRITLTETAQTSVTANIPGFRKLALAAATVAAAFGGDIGKEARTAVLEHGIKFLGEAVTDLANQQGYTGVTQQRLTQANERISMQVDLFKGSIQSLEGVDEFEAAAKVNGLKTQLEVSYSLTASMQKLSLLNYLS